MCFAILLGTDGLHTAEELRNSIFVVLAHVIINWSDADHDVG